MGNFDSAIILRIFSNYSNFFLSHFPAFLYLCRKMAIIKSVKGLTPRWGKECYFSENAAIVGEVTMGDRVNVQDGAVVHVTNKIGPTIIEDDVTIGHNATVHACTLKRGCLIGMGSTVLDNAIVGEGAVVAAGALVLGRTVIGPHEIWGGVPAKFIKKTNPDQAESYARHYVEYSKWYLAEE